MATTLVETSQRSGVKHVSVSQSAAEAADLVAAPADTLRIIVVEVALSISLDGTVVFNGAASDGALTGAINVSAVSGLHLTGTTRHPVFECSPGVKFAMTSVTGALRGYIKYKIVLK